MLKAPWREFADHRSWYNALSEDQKRSYNRKMFRVQMLMLWVWIGAAIATFVLHTQALIIGAFLFGLILLWWTARLRKSLGYK